MAEDIVDKVCRKLGKGGPCTTEQLPIGGGDIGVVGEYLERQKPAAKDLVDEACLAELVRSYGSGHVEVLDYVRKEARLGQRIAPDRPFILAQVRHAAEHEMAHTVADVALRRTDAGNMGDKDLAVGKAIAAELQQVLGLSAADVERQLAEYKDQLAVDEAPAPAAPEAAAPAASRRSRGRRRGRARHSLRPPSCARRPRARAAVMARRRTLGQALLRARRRPGEGISTAHLEQRARRGTAMAKDLEGKVFLVTGATEGIGKAAALEFAARGADLTITGRSKEKTERVLAELQAAAGGSPVHALLGDLSTIAEARRVAAEFKARRQRLDVLVNNAGAIFAQKHTSRRRPGDDLRPQPPGLLRAHDRALGPAQEHAGLAGRLHLERRALHGQARPVRRVPLREGLLHLARLRRLQARQRPVHTRALPAAGRGPQRQLRPPGLGPHRLRDEQQGADGEPRRRHRLALRAHAKKGAETIVWLAAAPEAAGISGQYLHDKKVASTSKLAKDDALAKDLWELSERLVRS
jgi:hypothetical protein